jgi:hypothetical protein
MKDELFNELTNSLREGGEILRGEVQPSRKFVVTKAGIKRITTRQQVRKKLTASIKTSSMQH